MHEKYVVIDTETTGNSPERGDRIIQIGLAVVENNNIVDTYATYLHPKREIPLFIQELTGITPTDVNDAPYFEEIAPILIDYLQDGYFVAHHVDFDLSFINWELQQAGYPSFHGPKIDTVECARMLYPTFDSYQLNRLATALHIKHDHPHQADSDAETTALLWLKLMKKIAQLPKPTVQMMLKILKYVQSDIDHLFKRSLRIDEEKIPAVSFQGLAIKPYLLQGKKRISKEKQMVEKEPFPSSVEHVLRTHWEKFEMRDGQEKIAQSVRDAFENNDHLCLEAPPGIGKTFAYLIPAIAFALRTNKQVLISTQTVALQEQLIEKDIPILKNAYPKPFEAVVLKGKSHYACLRKIKQLTSGTLVTYEEALGLLQVLVWILETDTGDIEELNIAGGKQNTLIEKLVCDETIFSRAANPWREGEYYFRMRQQANDAHLLIVNHALLFHELAKGQSFLPSVSHIVVDEAHHLEQVASQSFGEDVDYFQIKRLLNRFDIFKSKGYFSPLFFYEQEMVRHFSPGWYEKRKDHFMLLTYELDELFRTLHHFTLTEQMVERRQRKKTVTYRPTKEFTERWRNVIISLQRFLSLMETELDFWYSYVHVLEKAMNEDKKMTLLEDFFSFLQQIERTIDTLYSLLTQEEANYLYWLEVDVEAAENNCAISKRPIHVGDILANTFFQLTDSVVLMSSSFTIDRTFTYVKQLLGLEDFSPKTLSLPSPFSYDEQVRLYAPTDIGQIQGQEEIFIEDVSEFLFHLTSVVHGRILVLFTSFDMLQKTYGKMKMWEEESPCSFLVQGERKRGKEKLLKLFRQESETMLLGTNTFMEGVDIPSVKAVVLVRLPFSSPNEPIMKAKLQEMKRKGQDPFQERSIPEAVLRFKQAFGRLIRTTSDKGVFIVLDRRMMEKSYGKYFIQSLPNVPIERQSLKETLQSIVDFFDQNND